MSVFSLFSHEFKEDVKEALTLKSSLYIVRHAEATGQQPDAPLTNKGESDAERLADFFHRKGIKHIVSSPFARAVATAKPTAEKLALRIKQDQRLQERVLCGKPADNWLELLESSFQEMDKQWPGGESSNQAKKRILAVVEEAAKTEEPTVIVSHGNLISLLLHAIDRQFGFQQWKQMQCPEVFHIDLVGQTITKIDLS